MIAHRQRTKSEIDAIKRRVLELRRKDDELTQSVIATRLGVRVEAVRQICLDGGVPFMVRANQRKKAT